MAALGRALGLAAGVAVAALAAAAVNAVCRPVQLPQPRGPHRVGTVARHWIDDARADIFSSDRAARRELDAQVWFPTTANSGTTTTYLPDAELVFASLLEALRTVTGGRLRPPRTLFHKLAVTPTHALVDGPPAPCVHGAPVIVALSGFGGFRQANTVLIEELASRGYVVVGIDQPHVSARTRMADGSTVTMRRRGHLYDDAPREEAITHLADDVSLALDRMGADAEFAGVGLSDAGVLGISLGGTVAALAATRDARVRACLMMDAEMLSVVQHNGLPCHALWLTRPVEDMRRERRRTGGWPEDVIRAVRESVSRAASHQGPQSSEVVEIRGMSHLDFTDVPQWFPWARWLGLTGPIGARRGGETIAGHAIRFFDRSLRTPA